ncbi:MAG: cytochrome c oxidase accessory protein CcoG [Bacteroidetes bacterium]|nr:cytochrome c oxidase accessory protein CcoG [Bacteroidota bacterium]
MSQAKNTENYREHLGNVNEQGGRIWLFPKIIKGRLYKIRTYISWFYLAFFFAGPFIKIKGNPFLLLNVFERQFIIFGQPFWPQDFHFLVLLLITSIVFIVLFTVIYGRVFCGWVCPQTIFLEMVFRKIENWIEGNSNQQRKLKEMPWNREKIIKRGLKFIAFYGISFLIANTFLAYMIGWENLWAKITGPIAENYPTLIGLIIFSTVFYIVFAKVRELVCIMICPYGRLQGVMLDPNSMVVAYDEVRGEPRGKIRKNEAQDHKGDCVDCGLCVDVCPTGIDIRNGTQLECVNCTACIDACDSVMDKINKPRGLVRIDSINNIKNKTGFRFTPRIIAYSVFMVLLLGLFTTLLVTRTDIEAHVLRAPGKVYFEESPTLISNIYNIEMVNKTFDDKKFRMVVNYPNAQMVMVDTTGVLPANQEQKRVFLIKMERKFITSNKTIIPIDFYIGDEKIKSMETTFLAPVATN